MTSPMRSSRQLFERDTAPGRGKSATVVLFPFPRTPPEGRPRPRPSTRPQPRLSPAPPLPFSLPPRGGASRGAPAPAPHPLPRRGLVRTSVPCDASAPSSAVTRPRSSDAMRALHPGRRKDGRGPPPRVRGRKQHDDAGGRRSAGTEDGRLYVVFLSGRHFGIVESFFFWTRADRADRFEVSN